MRLASDILIDEGQIAFRVETMATAIGADTPEGSTLSVLALMDGAFMFCADLVRRLPMPVRLAFVQVISVGRGGRPEDVRLPEDFPIEGADLLIVEDILDTGQTMSRLRAVLEQRRPRSLRLAVLLDKPAQRAVEIRPDYFGFTMSDHWVVGYGLDSDGLYRNLPYISYVEP